MKTIEDVARFLGVSPKNKIKTLALMAEEKDAKTGKSKLRGIVVLMRGDHQLNEAKVASALSGKQTRPMQEDEIKQLFRSPAGFLGPIGIAWAANIKDGDRPVLLVDKALEGRKNLISRGQQRRLSPEKCDSRTQLPAHCLRRSAQSDRG